MVYLLEIVIFHGKLWMSEPDGISEISRKPCSASLLVHLGGCLQDYAGLNMKVMAISIEAKHRLPDIFRMAGIAWFSVEWLLNHKKIKRSASNNSAILYSFPSDDQKNIFALLGMAIIHNLAHPFIQWEIFRILKWRYVSTIFQAIFWWDIPLHRPQK